jgi:hypothetical protein
VKPPPVTHELALVSTSEAVPLTRLRTVGSALQTQISRDLAPEWNVDATVTVYEQPDAVPAGAWKALIVDDLGIPDRISIHTIADGWPLALVEAGADWELRLSHECLEMLVSPDNSLTFHVPSPEIEQTRALLIAQVCDPCSDPSYAYRIDDVVVSDFVTRAYFDVLAPEGARFDHNGQIARPLQATENGLITWTDPQTLRMYQASVVAGKRKVGEFMRDDRLGPRAAAIQQASSVTYTGT